MKRLAPLVACRSLLATAALAPGEGPEPLFLAPLPDRRGPLRQLHEEDRHQGQPHRGQRGRAARAPEERGRAQPRRRARDGRCRPPLARRADGPLPAGEVAVLEERIPGELRHPDGLWFAFSVRARPIFYLKGAVDPAQIRDYEDLADPKWKGKVCIRSSSNMYNLSLMSSMIADVGPAKAEEWAQGRRGQLRAQPQGRRHRPAQGRGRRRVPGRDRQHLLLRAPA